MGFPPKNAAGQIAFGGLGKTGRTLLNEEVLT
ncbi:hypothetical protein APT_01001 [Acetobacter pasteurianus NBRC 101655]|uniref:Uncharacterized protein n=5 Tax=Acetobacter TaxID=434 RepID=A0A401WSE7_ACEPA|nr:hypothetical protein S101447_00179 [Acetobacter ascendens]ASC04450.1 hypothetical protein S101468_00179 [Acetobacter pasteurianus subsp. pasteurianus]OAZ72924.1 hypothetical protein SRCM100623_01467 [Acetobacter pasteurianus]BAU38083.1 hypothetical protein APT_01001 [Acetobacter pasteurianus NBRC 101655]GCD49412.1 hypothetical protein NBRC106471_0968 [Acetobacter pasteurianus subsp. pasteurianus LMG 1262 = NBRC 106471]GCD52243.1 hypothetical protein NBRC3188_0940 [Acetobacter pasteurianus N